MKGKTTSYLMGQGIKDIVESNSAIYRLLKKSWCTSLQGKVYLNYSSPTISSIYGAIGLAYSVPWTQINIEPPMMPFDIEMHPSLALYTYVFFDYSI